LLITKLEIRVGKVEPKKEVVMQNPVGLMFFYSGAVIAQSIFREDFQNCDAKLNEENQSAIVCTERACVVPLHFKIPEKQLTKVELLFVRDERHRVPARSDDLNKLLEAEFRHWYLAEVVRVELSEQGDALSERVLLLDELKKLYLFRRWLDLPPAPDAGLVDMQRRRLVDQVGANIRYFQKFI